ncbi:conserved hypothetical protein [uncultured Alphaproteobacteria bacterium]|uniref:Uncharacterized protein n=1 Tax=uncultured Alphaproteobacteria bacterium TaxID=91750 RepID=A0A212JI90_9PROT|nr:conserved hypothetical protein [uncultured Alphaproteobacteria bacterium]
MNEMDRTLTIFIYLWASLIALANLVGIATEFYLYGFSGGIDYIQETYSPYNLINFVVEIISLSPALIAYLWREKRRARKGPLYTA